MRSYLVLLTLDLLLNGLHGTQSEKPVIQVDNEGNYLKKKFESLVNEHESNSVCSVHNIDDNTAQAKASKVCGCSCSVELEGLKLDMTILESRLLSALSQSELESDVRFLTVKLKELEAVIRHQDEVICALNDDNEFFKARLLAFEKIPFTEAHNKNELRVIDKATTSRVSDQINKSNLSLINSEINNTSCIINHPCDSEQCNASVLNRNQVDLTNDVLPPSKQQLIQQKQSSVSRVNDDSVNVLNKNYFELRNDDMLPPKQSLEPGELPSVSKVNDVLPLNKQKETKHQDENINVNLRSKPREKTNNVGRKNDDDPSLKRSTPCPFLVRRGRCLKGNQCDFKHPSSEPLKHNSVFAFTSKLRHEILLSAMLEVQNNVV